MQNGVYIFAALGFYKKAFAADGFLFKNRTKYHYKVLIKLWQKKCIICSIIGYLY